MAFAVSRSGRMRLASAPARKSSPPSATLCLAYSPLLKEVEGEQFARKDRALRKRESRSALEIAVRTRDRHENANLAVKAFELSQNVVVKWDWLISTPSVGCWKLSV
ncbi:hypothetical protein R5W23_004077 [Gemmata sp. JC673]|uniref:Uncharacterized protein n=1 Tax=Gemmata algarum TaxID=2975278 RepID=A0ABU5F4V4_9BACT|nr:hypothetical protein [Gemmata algarum]MDY3562611.1 hypothetical protein [Gemmata algarum]